MSDLNNNEQNNSPINVDQDKLGKEKIIEKDIKYEEQKPNKSQLVEESTSRESNMDKNCMKT